MNLFDLLWMNTDLHQTLQNAMQKCLSARTKRVVSPGKIVLRENPSEFDVTSFCLLRLRDKNCVAPIVLGSTQSNFEKALTDVLKPAEGQSIVDAKGIETFHMDMLKAIAGTLGSDYLSMNLVTEQKCVYVPSKGLGAWTAVKTQHSIQFPFTITAPVAEPGAPPGTPGTTVPLTLEIPVFADSVQQKITVEYSGFLDNSRILVVDDSPTTRKLMRYTLATAGYMNLDECADGQTAFNRVTQATPGYDLVIADWHMPNLTGLELLKKLRAMPAHKNLPILLVTGERNKEEIMAAIRERVSGYIVKPFDGETLFKTMKKAAPKVEDAQKQVA